MGSRISRILIPLVLIILVLSFARLVYSVTNSSPIGQFNVTPDILYLNWTNSPTTFRDNITIWNKTLSNLTIKVFNASNTFTENYSQGNTVSACQNNSLTMSVQNATHTSENATIVNEQNITVIFNTANCLPGRYRTTNFTVANLTQQNESANITVVLDLPINNTGQTTGIGSFNGAFPANYTTYQSYYFNTSLIPNATSVTINASGWSSSSDVDLFLFDNTSTPVFKSKSANKTANESIRFQYLPKDAFWEIRVFGNSTSAVSYSGNIFYSTLNMTNPANSNFQVGVLNVSSLNASQTNNTNVTIRNSGGINISNVTETKELYRMNTYTGSGTRNFTVMVPDSSVFNRIKVLLNWTGVSNYSFNLYNSSGGLVASAINQHVQANVSGTYAEIYNETGSMNSNTGNWLIQLINNTNVTNDDFNLVVLEYVNSSAWIATNYSTFTFNSLGNTNNSVDVGINLTVPNNSVDGVYQGQLLYLDASNRGISLPLWLNVTTPVLAVNSTMNSMSYRIDENIGANLTRNFNFWINNTGSSDMSITYTKASGNLNFSFNSTNGTIPAKSYSVMSVSVQFYSSNSSGTYDGAIFMNATNSTLALSSHPYQTFNLSVRLNLTNLLNVSIFDIRNRTGTTGTNLINSSSTDNVTIGLMVQYLNGTNITNSLASIDTSNFTAAWFTEGNISTKIPTSTNITPSIGTNPIYQSSNPTGLAGPGYYINVTPSGGWAFPGGRYVPNVNVNYMRNDSVSFTGVGTGSSLVINNAGLYMTAMNSTSISIANLSTYVFAVNISNYGALAASSPTINFSHSCNYTVSSPSYVNCPSTSFVPNPFTSSCVVKWTITGASTAQAACGATIVGTPSTIWHNPSGVTLSITTTLSSGTSSSSSSASAAAAAAAAAATPNVSLAFSLADTIVYVEQNKTNTSTAQVKNTGVSTQTVTFSVDTLASSWFSINNTNTSSLGSGKVIGYLVTFKPGNADVKDYSANFVATGSASSATAAFKLRVLPGAEKRAEISSTFDQLNVNFTSLTDELNKTKKEGKNITDAQQKYDMLKAKLDQANTYIKNGDFFSAYQLINDIKSLFTETKAALSSSTVPSGFNLGNLLGAQAGYLTYVLIGGGVAAGAFVAYLFWPSKAPGAAYKAGPTKPLLGESVQTSVKDRFQFMKKIKEFFSKLFNRGPKQTYQVK